MVANRLHPSDPVYPLRVQRSQACNRVRGEFAQRVSVIEGASLNVHRASRGKMSVQLRNQGVCPFVCQQPALALELISSVAVVEAAQAARGDDAMAGEDDGPGIVPQRLAYRSGAGADAAGEFGVGERLAYGNFG